MSSTAPSAPSRISSQVLESLLAAIVRLDIEAIARAPHVDAALLCAAAEGPGLVALVADALDDLPHVSAAWRSRCSQRARELAAIDIVKESEFHGLLDDLADGNHPFILMKGAQLAYSLYARPDLRPRIDTDLLIPHSSLDRTLALLRKRGYAALGAQQEGDLLRYQVTVVKRAEGTDHVVDVHWRVMDPHPLAHVLDYDSVARWACTIPRLGSAVLGLDEAHALLLACVHRLAHHRGSRPLIWLFDIHMLAQSLAADQWERFLEECSRMRVAAVCARGLRDARATFATVVPAHVLSDGRLTPSTNDASTRYLRASRPAEALLGDLHAMPAWRDRVRLMKQYVCPPAAYMRNVYAPNSRLPLPLLYVVRLLKGSPKWLAKS
ncbi:MAG: nucleotidyltransferase family protein [Vicinamibacterales bacterium]